MIAVGNDVVDLRDRDCDPATLHPRFDGRVFAAEERRALSLANDASRLRWRLWAAKEAAYKAGRKHDPTLVFAPSRFVAQPSLLAGGRAGELIHPGGVCAIHILEQDDAVHAVATLERQPDHDRQRGKTKTPVAVWTVLGGLLRLGPHDARATSPDGPSQAVRELAIERLSKRLRVPASQLEVRMQGRIPELWLKGARCPADLSLSHHGELVAFACGLVSQTDAQTLPRPPKTGDLDLWA